MIHFKKYFLIVLLLSTDNAFCENHFNELFIHYDGAYYSKEYNYKTNYLPAFIGASYKYRLKKYKNVRIKFDFGSVYSNYRTDKLGIWQRGISQNVINTYFEKTSLYVGFGYEYQLVNSKYLNFYINGGLKYRPYSNNSLFVYKDFLEIIVQNLYYYNSPGIYLGSNFSIPLTSRLSIGVDMSYTRFFNTKKIHSHATGQEVLDPQRNTFISQVGFSYSFTKYK